MSDIPFHVAGGAFIGRKPQTDRPPEIGPISRFTAAPAASSRRRKLWEVAHKCHCPIIGTCFDVQELRALMAKVMEFPRDTSDFVLHTTAVGNCDNRSRLAELLHKHLEKRHAAEIRKFSATRDTAELRALWRAACRDGSTIAGALWATWSHPACDSTLEHEVYGDIHMIQHQLGGRARVDHGALKRLREEHAEQARALADAREALNRLRHEHAREVQGLMQRLIDLQAESAGKDARLAALNGQHEHLQNSLPDMKDRQALARRATDAEALNVALTARSSQLEEALQRERRRNALLETELQLHAHHAEPAHASVAPDLGGKCVLCVGGRSGAIDAYRQVVERSGGRFLHHDGGLEESLHRIDSALAAADLVICQTGCISHNAYWRVKEQCKRTGKQCMFVKTSGASGFERAIQSASRLCEGVPALPDHADVLVDKDSH